MLGSKLAQPNQTSGLFSNTTQICVILYFLTENFPNESNAGLHYCIRTRTLLYQYDFIFKRNYTHTVCGLTAFGSVCDGRFCERTSILYDFILMKHNCFLTNYYSTNLLFLSQIVIPYSV